MNKKLITITLLASLISVFPIPDKVSEEGGKVAPPVVYAEKLPELSKAPVAELSVKPVESTAKPQTASTQPVSYPQSDNFYKNFIYQHESGNNPNSVNSIGCRGLGQACPGTKLPCGADYACQDAYFTNYAMQRYGSWEAAYGFWTKNRWW